MIKNEIEEMKIDLDLVPVYVKTEKNKLDELRDKILSKCDLIIEKLSQRKVG